MRGERRTTRWLRRASTSERSVETSITKRSSIVFYLLSGEGFRSIIEHMFPRASTASTPAALDVLGWISGLSLHDADDLTDTERIDLIAGLEALKSAAAATQAKVTEAFDRSQREAAPSLKPVAEVSRSIASQVALARNDSPARGQRHLGVANALVRDLPDTLSALSRGEISEWAATLVVRETATLSREDRMTVDRELAGRLPGAGDKRVADLARSAAHRLDPGAALRRTSKAESDRRVSIRPAPDTMSLVTGLLPVAQGVAVYAALKKEADSRRVAGDLRTTGQIMADTFYQRLTGQKTAGAPDIEIGLVMHERSLMRGSHEPARVLGYGPVPAALARRLVLEADRAWIRRLYTAPETGHLVTMDSKRRPFRGKLRQLIVLRDQTCRTPWCDAPIAHADHVRAVRSAGKTKAANGQGLCEACNYAKEAPGWRARVIDITRHVIEITTPAGHTYVSRPPPQPGADPPSPEERLRRLGDDVA